MDSFAILVFISSRTLLKMSNTDPRYIHLFPEECYFNCILCSFQEFNFVLICLCSFLLQRLLLQCSRTGFCPLIQCCLYKIPFDTFDNYISSCSYLRDSQMKDPVKHQDRQNVPLHYSTISVKELTAFPLYYTVVLPLLVVSSNN